VHNMESVETLNMIFIRPCSGSNYRSKSLRITVLQINLITTDIALHNQSTILTGGGGGGWERRGLWAAVTRIIQSPMSNQHIQREVSSPLATQLHTSNVSSQYTHESYRQLRAQTSFHIRDHKNFSRGLHPEDGGSKVLRNVSSMPQPYTTSQPRRIGLEWFRSYLSTMFLLTFLWYCRCPTTEWVTGYYLWCWFRCRGHDSQIGRREGNIWLIHHWTYHYVDMLGQH